MGIIHHKTGLLWDFDAGVGYFPVELNGQYNREYWEKYVGYRSTPMGERLMRERALLVGRYIPSDTVLVDIGIGAGHFIDVRNSECKGFPKTFGYDVNLEAIRWLVDRRLWWDPYFMDPPNASCWDSLEHMTRPSNFVNRVRGYLFISIPIFRDLDHVLASKHFRRNEHFWYFTEDGLVQWMENKNFELLEANDIETKIGREDIGTFVFRRRAGQLPIQGEPIPIP